MTSFSQVRTFSTDNNNQNQNQNDDSNNTKPISNRAAFKAIPIHQSALSYIRNIGVGLRPMQRKNKKVRKKSHDRNKNDNIEVSLKQNDKTDLSASSYSTR